MSKKKYSRLNDARLGDIVRYLRKGFKKRQDILKEMIDTSEIPNDLELFDWLIAELKERIEERE